MNTPSIRFRLTVWYAGLLAGMLVLFGAAAAKYVDAFMQNVNWEEVNRRFTNARKVAALKA